MIARTPLSGPSAWRGDEIAHSTRWLRDLSPRALAEIDAALGTCRAKGIPWHQTTREAFPLPGMADDFADIRRELEDGCGMVKLRGLPVARYSPDDLRQIWFGLGSNLGQPVFQNRSGELMREIRDEGADVGERYGQIHDNDAKGEASAQVVLSSYARTLSNGALRFHTDRCDVVGLLCVNQARAGGVSTLASSVAIRNEILKRRPDLLEVLYQVFYRSRFGEEGATPDAIYALPIFGERDGKFTSHYSLTFIEVAQKVPGVPRLTAGQHEAIEMLMALAKELSFEMRFEPGDIQLLNNHVVYHGRTPFEDDDRHRQRRSLYRLWLAMPNSRALPEDHAILWGQVAAGALRGGIGQSRPA
ncbi:MAG TPA: TauD/TfdA family dioxygenase [Alphaproteobacteria bacterium]